MVISSYAVLVPNYHGSFGYGDAFLHSLCGHIGTIEVYDVLDAIHTLVREEPCIDSTRIYIMGSSYGGFIGLHLLEKAPTLFAVSGRE